jgi:hypothetical protein
MYILCPRVRTTWLPRWNEEGETARPLLPKRPQLREWLGGGARVVPRGMPNRLRR